MFPDRSGYKATLSLLLTIHVVLFDLLFLLSAFILAFSCLFMVLVLTFQLLYHCRSVYMQGYFQPSIHYSCYIFLPSFWLSFPVFILASIFYSCLLCLLFLLYAIKVYITQLHKTSSYNFDGMLLLVAR